MAKIEALWSRKLDQLMKKRPVKSYSALAELLNISRQKLNDARRGRQEMPGEAKADVVSILEEPISLEEYESLFPKKTREASSPSIARIYDPIGGKKLTSNFWVGNLNKLKKLSDIKSDSELASRLNISPSMISNTRQGKGSLSPAAKIKVLDKLGYMASRDVLIDLLPKKTADRIKKYDNLRFKVKNTR